jgi:hypothetical protein
MKHVSETETELNELTQRLTAIQTEMTTLARARPRLTSPAGRWSNQARVLALSTEQRELLLRQRQIKTKIARMNGYQFKRNGVENRGRSTLATRAVERPKIESEASGDVPDTADGTS